MREFRKDQHGSMHANTYPKKLDWKIEIKLENSTQRKCRSRTAILDNSPERLGQHQSLSLNYDQVR